MTIDVLVCKLDGSQEVELREVPDDYLEAPDEPDPEPVTDDVESRIWAAMAAAIEEGVNSLDG